MLRNVVFNLGTYLYSVISALLLAPFILRHLGDARYGIWAVIGEVLTYYGLLDFGIRAALNYFIGGALARCQTEQLKRYASSAFFGLLVIATLGLLLSLGALMLLRDVIDIKHLDRTEVLASAVIFLTLFCVSLPLEVYPSILIGQQKLYLVNAMEVGARLVAMILMFILLGRYPSLLTICVSHFTVRSIYYLLGAFFVRRMVPGAEISLRLSSWGCLRELVGYGSQSAIINLSWLLITRKDAVLITVFLGARWVPFYHFARLIVENITHACHSITLALRPTLIYYWAKGERDRVYAIYYGGARYTIFVAGMLAAFFFAYGSDFLRLWIGPRFVTGPAYFRTDLVLLILLGANLPRWMHSISWQLLFATNKQRALSWLIVAESLVNTGLALLLVRPFGILGIALATFLPMLVSQGCLLPWMMQRLVGISWRRYLYHGVMRPGLAAGVVFGACSWTRHTWPPSGWGLFVLQGLALGLLALLLGLCFVARPEERAWAWRKLLSFREWRSWLAPS